MKIIEKHIAMMLIVALISFSSWASTAEALSLTPHTRHAVAHGHTIIVPTVVYTSGYHGYKARPYQGKSFGYRPHKKNAYHKKKYQEIKHYPRNHYYKPYAKKKRHVMRKKHRNRHYAKKFNGHSHRDFYHNPVRSKFFYGY